MRFALLLLALSLPALAQDNTCGGTLTSVVDTTQLQYPPIARAAHVSGLVILLATFRTTGEVDHLEVVSGPVMLQRSAKEYVQGWRANEYTGPRTCPVVIGYFSDQESSDEQNVGRRVDPQHVNIHGYMPPLIGENAQLSTFSRLRYRLKRLLHLH